MKLPVSDLPIMKACCKSCPFKLDQHSRMQDGELANKVIERTLFKAQQICHSTNINRCKGSFDFNYEIYDRMGLSHLIKK